MKPALIKQKLCAFGAPLILLIVSIIQLYLVSAQDMTRWKGGGFGMFSTVDSLSARWLRITVITPEGEVRVEPATGFERLARNARSLPTQGRLSHLANELATLQWMASDTKQGDQPATEDDVAGTLASLSAEKPTDRSSSSRHPAVQAKAVGEPGQGKLLAVQRVQVELWRYAFDPASLQVKAYKHGESVTRAHSKLAR